VSKTIIWVPNLSRILTSAPVPTKYSTSKTDVEQRIKKFWFECPRQNEGTAVPTIEKTKKLKKR
jgi:hypothetical protein